MHHRDYVIVYGQYVVLVCRCCGRKERPRWYYCTCRSEIPAMRNLPGYFSYHQSMTTIVNNNLILAGPHLGTYLSSPASYISFATSCHQDHTQPYCVLRMSKPAVSLLDLSASSHADTCTCVCVYTIHLNMPTGRFILQSAVLITPRTRGA